MTASAMALAGLIGWHLVLTFLIFGHRGLLVLGGRLVNSFATDGRDVSAFSARVCRAHANSYESIPFTMGVLVLALVTGQSAVTDALAMAMLGARVAQSLVHILSTSVMAVNLRFAFFLAQWGIAAYWLYRMVCV